MNLSFDRFSNSNYIAIIEMGWDVVPLIIEKLREDPCHLFVALVRITGENPVKYEHRGRIAPMAKDWIEWWENYSSTNRKTYER
jgi:hypothetical protein